MQCWAPTIILEGVFEDMNQLNYIDFTRPWWFGDIIDQFTLDGHTTVAYGAITPISIFGGTEVVHFNKNLCEDFGDVTLKYYESIIGYKYSSDMQNAEMLDLMFNNFSYEPIWVYSKATTDLVVTYSQNMNLGVFFVYQKAWYACRK